MGCCESTPIDIPTLTIPGVRGKVIARDGSQAYKDASYQYASSSYLNEYRMQPAVIIYAHDENDVKAVIRYANDRGIAVAIRTGGHQYSGASSTTGGYMIPSVLTTMTCRRQKYST